MSTGDAPVVYASWTQPGGLFTVEYSVPIFHEIDVVVSEGYRRIAHGGIEVGGLLFGRPTADGIRLEAFLPIECEHAAGPSFKLSERDVAGLRKQMGLPPPGQAGVSGLQVVGWFIAHTRSELQMNEMEAALFNEVLPGPGKITALVKPEKFKATRFTFLVRGADGSLERDGVDQSFVLPLPGRAAHAETVVPAVAPERTTLRREPLDEPVKAPPPAAPVPPPPVEPVSSPVAPVPTSPAQIPVPDIPIAVPVGPVRLPREQAPVQEPAWIAPRPPPVQPPGIPPASIRIERREIERRQLARGVRAQPSEPKLIAAVFLILAGLLGCGIGYWTYLQLPAAVIPLDLRPAPEGLTLSWPAELTRDADEVAMRVNDGDPLAVSAKDKISGRSEVAVSGDSVKVELIVRHWIRDSRGIVRFVGPANAPAR